MHTIPEALATSIAAARLITCTGSSVTSAPASPGTGDAGFFLVLAMNNHALPWKRNGEAARGTRAGKSESDRRARSSSTQPARPSPAPDSYTGTQGSRIIPATQAARHNGPQAPPRTSSAGNRAGHEHPAQCTLKNAAARHGGTGSTRARLPCRGTRRQPAKDGRGAKFRGYLTPPRPFDSYEAACQASALPAPDSCPVLTWFAVVSGGGSGARRHGLRATGPEGRCGWS